MTSHQTLKKLEKDYVLNHHRTKSFQDKILLTTDHGSWVLLTKQEYGKFKRLPKNQKQKAFYKYWTIKEALGKARGTGLSESINRINFSKTLNEQEIKFNYGEYGTINTRWSIISFSPFLNYVAAVAVELNNQHLHKFQFSS